MWPSAFLKNEGTFSLEIRRQSHVIESGQAFHSNELGYLQYNKNIF